ncbi:hypothetical protein [Abyssicoccus albus]|uniref:hypothetical protein n=1 Tax=Abyssicoccus albus TaxID=1817405 RepID=UPI00097E1E62|nr:hypothetical protein [Abyssicoccus albus]AQL55444.1 hypothetical protein BVH56_00040 [Abyssicoccus albus]
MNDYTRVIKLDEEKGRKNYENLLKNKLLDEICNIYKSISLKDSLKEINVYTNSKTYIDNKPSRDRSGRVWILVSEITRVLTLGQSIDIIEEIKKLTRACYEEYLHYNQYHEFYEQYEKLTFYEIKIDEYLKMMHNVSDIKNDIVKLIYDLGKEYFVEAEVAYTTSAMYWNYCNSGMDRRMYDYIKS